MPSFYRCENEFGDPCIFAEENRKIPAAEALPNMEGGMPRCPGKTQSGKECGRELIPIDEKPPISLVRLMIAAGILGGITLLWFVVPPMFQKPDLPAQVDTTEVILDIPEESDQVPINDPIKQPVPPIVRTMQPVQPEPPVDPWWVYEQLETTSTILRTEP